MSKIWLPGGGGSADLDVITAGAGDVLAGKVIVDPDGEPLTGTLALTGTAADSQVLSGKTYYNTDAKTKRTGGMPNNGVQNASLNCGQSKDIPAGYTTGGRVTANSLASQTPGTAAASQILSGKTAWVNGGKLTGSMANRGAYGGAGNSRGNDAGNQRMWVRVPGGYYSENANVYLSWADIRSMAGLTADKIRKGQSIMGIIGSFEGYVTSPLYLYKDGVWSNLQTTGITGVCDTYITSGMYANSESVLPLQDNLAFGAARLIQNVDLSAYRYLRAKMYGYYCAGRIGVSTSPNITALSQLTKYSMEVAHNEEKFVDLDISTLSGKYYIYFLIRQISNIYHSSITIKQLYLTDN